jgi:hypothetical protein
MIHRLTLGNTVTKKLRTVTHSMIHPPKILGLTVVNRLVNHAYRIAVRVKRDPQILQTIALDLVPSNVHRSNILPAFYQTSSGFLG